MKIALIAPTYLPALRANTIQVMKMAQALVTLGHDIRVFVPQAGVKHQQLTWDDLAHHYGIRRRFEIEWLPRDPRLRSYDYGLKSVRRARNLGVNLIYTRLPQSAALASLMGIPSIYEIHDLPQGRIGPWLLIGFMKGSGARAMVLITSALSDAVTERYGQLLNNRKGSSLPIIVEPDGVDLARYQNVPTPQKARESLSLSLPSSSLWVGYTGHLYPGRGSELILDIAGQLPGINFLLVGGEIADVSRVRQKIKNLDLKNISLTGFIPNADLPQYQAACDILLMPYQRTVAGSSGGDIAKYLSPMKLFEYMACGRAIISSDLPVLQEILNRENAVLLPPDDLTAWVTAIQDLNANSHKRAKLAAQAQQDAQQYSWNARAQKIISVIPNESQIASH